MLDTNQRVLVVDDMATVRLVVNQCLSELGYKDIIEATNGQTGWDMLTTSSPPVSLILSDWNMPKLTGIDFVKLVRADRRYAKIPFVLITTEVESKKVVEAIKAGVDDYVVKPFTLETIASKIESAYRKKGLL